MLSRLYNTPISDRLITSHHYILLKHILRIGTLAFLLYSLFVYFVFSHQSLALLNFAAFVLFLFIKTDFKINQNFMRTSTLSSTVFALFFILLIYLTDNKDLTLLGTILLPIFVIAINGRFLGLLYAIAFYAIIYLLAYQGIDIWNNGTFSQLSYTHFIASSLILICFIYFIECSFDTYIKQFYKQNKQLKEAQKIANIGSWEWDIKSGVLQWSDETYHMFNFDREKEKPSYERFLAVVHPQDRQMVEDAVNEAIHNQTCYNIVHRIQPPNAAEKVVRECGEVYYDEQNNPCRMVGTVQDITKQQTTTEALYEQKVAFETIFNKSHDGVLIIKDGKFIDCNDAAVQMLKASSKGQVLKSNPVEISPEIQPNGCKSSEHARQMIQKAFSEGTSVFECMHKAFDNSLFLVDVVLTRIEINNESVIHVSWRDITEKKALEKELRGYQLNLEQLVETKTKEMVIQKKRAEAANKAKSEFLANMNHELRTPMNAILGFIHLLSVDETDPKRQKYFTLVQEGSQALLDIINDVLDFSKIESGKFTLHLKDVDIVQSTTTFIEFLSGAAKKKSINYHVDIDKSIPMMNIDLLRLEQIISNLIGNAIKFTPEHGDISIKLFFDAQNKQLVFSVKDSGIGISKANQEKIFQPFSQVDMSSTRAFAGTGLGLTITLELIKLFDGKLQIKSEEGKGSEFGFTIPYKKALSEINTHALFEAPEIELSRNKSILLAEDNEMNLYLFEELFKKLEIRNVTFVSNGKEALEAYKQHAFDLLLLDIDMPVMNGKEAYSEIRAYEEENNIKTTTIVAVTASSDEENKSALEKLGFDGFLAKPVNFKNFKEMINKYL